jgi:TonB family protein
VKPLTVFALLCLALLPLSAAAAPAVPTAAEGPFRVGDEVTKPEKLSGDPPAYPAKAREAGVSGIVILEAVINEGGEVRDVRVLKGQPAGLSEAAVKAVESWKFKPATKAGLPVPVYYTLTVNFQTGPPDDPYEVLQKIASARAEWPEPPAPDAERVAAIEAAVTSGSTSLALTAGWATGYRGDSRSALMTWIGEQALHQAQQRPVAVRDTERTAMAEIGLGAVNAAITNEGLNARTWWVAEANAYKHLLLKVLAEQTADPVAKEQTARESFQALAEAVQTYNALTSAAVRNQARNEAPTNER